MYNMTVFLVFLLLKVSSHHSERNSRGFSSTSHLVNERLQLLLNFAHVAEFCCCGVHLKIEDSDYHSIQTRTYLKSGVEFHFEIQVLSCMCRCTARVP